MKEISEQFRHTGNPALYLIAKAHGNDLAALVSDLRWLLSEQMRDHGHISDRDAVITLGALCDAEGLRAQDGKADASSGRRAVSRLLIEMLVKKPPQVITPRVYEHAGCVIADQLRSASTANEIMAHWRCLCRLVHYRPQGVSMDIADSVVDALERLNFFPKDDLTSVLDMYPDDSLRSGLTKALKLRSFGRATA